MSFNYGSFDSDSLDLIATLVTLPSLGGLQLETLEAPGTDGLVFGGVTRSSTRFVFDVILRGDSSADAIGRSDAVAAALDPAKGPQGLVVDALPGWSWSAILAEAIEWERLTWDTGTGFQLRANVTFEALEAYGRPEVDETWPGLPGGTVTRQLGNARSYPTVEIEGALSVAQSVQVTVGAVDLTVTGPLLSGEVMRLDWDRFEFARWSGGTKVASLIRNMSTLDRPELWPGQETPFTVSSTGTLTRADLIANSRRQ